MDKKETSVATEAPRRDNLTLAQEPEISQATPSNLFVEVSTTPNIHTGDFIPLSGLDNWIEKQRKANKPYLYRSIFAYDKVDSKAPARETLLLGDLVLDFDDSPNTNRARAKQEALKVLNYLKENGVVVDNIQIYFSGRRGIHLVVSYQLFGIGPTKDLDKIYKVVAKDWANPFNLKLKTLDLQTYERRHMYRLPNTQHQESGLWKIPLAVDELEGLNTEQIKILAREPRFAFNQQVSQKADEKLQLVFRNAQGRFNEEVSSGERLPAEDNQEIDDLKKGNPIIKVADRLGIITTENYSGGTVGTHCFNHPDEHPSLVLMPDVHRFECKGCGIKGDVLDLIQRVKKIGFKEAVLWLDPEFYNNGSPEENPSEEVFPSTQLQNDDRLAAIHIPNASEFLNQDFGTTEWQVQDLIPIGGSCVIVAKRESFKTWLGLYSSDCITKGNPLWDRFKTHKCPVLYISNDDPVPRFKNRLKQFEFDNSFFIYHNRLPNFSLEQDNGSFLSVKNLIREELVGVVVVDILRNTHNRDSNTDKDAKWVLGRFKELRSENHDLVLIYLIHPSKEDAFERRFGKRQVEEAVGSYLWEADVDTVLSLTKTTDEELTDSVTVRVTKNKQSDKKIPPFLGIKRRNGEPVEFIYEEIISEKLKLDQAKEFIIESLAKQGYKRQELLDLIVGAGICGQRTAEDALKELFSEKQVSHTESKPHVYSLVERPEEDSANRNSIYELRNAESLTTGGTEEKE